MFFIFQGLLIIKYASSLLKNFIMKNIKQFGIQNSALHIHAQWLSSHCLSSTAQGSPWPALGRHSVNKWKLELAKASKLLPATWPST